MVDTREKFREMLNDIAATDGITKFNKLAEMTGINAVTFTRIKNNEIKSVSEETFWKLNNAFNKRYNIRWFQGGSRHMLLADYLAEKQNNYSEFDIRQDITRRAQEIQMDVLGHTVKESEVINGMVADDDPRPHLPTWADTLLGIISKQVAENEILHSELKQSIAEVNNLKTQLFELISNLKK